MRNFVMLLVALHAVVSLAQTQGDSLEPKVVVVPYPGDIDAGAPVQVQPVAAPAPVVAPVEAPPPVPPAEPATRTIDAVPPNLQPSAAPAEPVAAPPPANSGAMLDGHPREGPFLSGPGSMTFVLHHSLMMGLGVLATQMVPRINTALQTQVPEVWTGQDARIAYLAGALIGGGLGFGTSAWWQFNHWISANTANTVGTPSDATGTAIPGLTNVTAQDTAQVTLTPIALPGSIGDTVFIDANGNNTFDAGEGIPGITVVLTLPGNLTQTTTTTGDGHYLFTNLPSGAYVVTVQTSGTVLNGLTNHVDPDGGNNSTSSLTLAPGENNLLQDFGYLPAQQSPLGAIGDFVWQDTNGNGIQENGEPGLPNIAVTLFDSNNNVVKTITTDATGHYLFSNLPAGNYTVGFALPSTGFFFSPPNQGNDDAVDSDAGQNGQTGSGPTICSISRSSAK